MDIKDKIKIAIEKSGADFEKLNDLFSMVRLCEDPQERREWVLYVRLEARKLRSAEGYDLIRKTYVLGAQDGSFDDYCIALEWYRDAEKRFYLPRREVLKPLVDDLQDLYDGKLDFLGVSLPPRVGKALAFETPVLTRNGWKTHGDLTVRDEVLAPNGAFVKVLAIHPVCEMEYELTFTNGEKIICHGNHEWDVYNHHTMRYERLETKAMLGDYQLEIPGEQRYKYCYLLPETSCSSEPRQIAIRNIRRIDGVKGNCITVEGGRYLVGKTLLPTHNSTLCIFFMTFIMGNRPSAASVMSGHSDKLTDGFYRELLSIITDDTQYRWHDIFPTVQMVDNSAKNETIDLERKKRFPTITCRSISGTLTGAVEIGTGGVLYCDDLIEDLEESLNPVRLQNKYDAYLNQLKDRKKLGAVELMVGTRWNVADPLGRIEEQYRDNPRYRFTVIPALNDNGESNFNYKYDLGFDTEYYEDMKESIDDATWMAKYMGNPYVREGLLFPAAELRYYNGVLPDGEPDRIMAVVDTAWGGGDSLCMPVAKIFGDDVYIDDVVFNSGDKTVTRPLVIGTLKKHHPHMVRWESNNGGDEYGGIVDEKLRQDGVRMNMSYKKAPTNQSKLSRIIQYAPDIKKFYFIDGKHRSAEYEKFMRELTMFTVSGKNLHDDAPDACAMLVDFIAGGVKMVTVAKRPF